MDNGTQTELTLRRMPQGGYVVEDAISIRTDPGRFCIQRFASSSIDDALTFMRNAILPIGPQPGH